MPWYKIPNRMPRNIRIKGGRKFKARANPGIKPKLEMKPVKFIKGPRPPPFDPMPMMQKGMTLGQVIAYGNYETRNFRQKPIVTLQTATHTPNPNRNMKAQKVVVPVVVPKNNLSTTITKMPVVYKTAYPSKKVKKTKKQAKNSKNGPVKVKTQPAIPPAIKKELKEIKKSINVDKAIHTYKQAGASTVKSLIGRCNHYAISDVDLTQLEAACTNLRYYDPAAPGTLVTANANTGTFARDVFFKSYFTKIVFRNNYQVPVRLRVYHCKVKNDTNETPLTTYTTAIADQVITAGVDETDLLIHLTDIERVKEVWKVDCLVDKTLEPGQEAVTSNSTNSINFDPSHADSYTNAYQQVFKGSCYVIRVEGILGHDTAVTTEQSILLAGVDFEMTRKAVIEYDAGVDLDDIYISETRIQAFSNGGVCSLKPVADNIAYSIS